MTEISCIEVVEKSSNLVDSAHQMLLKAKQHVSRNSYSPNDRVTMKSLRYQLNQGREDLCR